MPICYKSTAAREPFTFESVGINWEQERVVRLQGYPAYHYLQSEEGTGRIQVQGRTYVLNEGEGVLLAPFISHSYEKISEKWTTCFLTFAGSMESMIADMLGNRYVIFLKEQQAARRAAAIIDGIFKTYQETPAATKSLSVECYRLLMEFVEGSYGDEAASEPLYVRYVAPVVKRIQKEYASELTVQELGDQVYITPQYLSRLFVRFLGCSTYEYLTNYRISRAKELLSRGRMEIQQIAGEVGFEESSHFIAVFKKRTGLTPYQFRKMNRG